MLTDRLGNAVPTGGHVETAFADSDIIRQCLVGISNYASVLARLHELRKPSVVSKLGKYREFLPVIALQVDNILEAFPFTICEVCKGEPKALCKGCNGRGWHGREEYELNQCEKEVGKRDDSGARKNPMQFAKAAIRILKTVRFDNDEDE